MVPQLPSAPHHHQRVTTTCWLVPQPSSALSPPPTSHRDSLDVPQFLSALNHHQQVTTTHWLVPGFHLPPTTTNESQRLVGGFLSFHLPALYIHSSGRVLVQLYVINMYNKEQSRPVATGSATGCRPVCNRRKTDRDRLHAVRSSFRCVG